VLVTGGATGIGLAAARAFARHGAELVLVSRNEENLQAACDQISDEGGSAGFHQADVRDAERLDAVASEVGDVDVLINAAAGNFPAVFSGMSRNAWDTVVDIVLKGTANASRSFAPALRKRKGCVLNIVAGYAWTGAPAMSHSGAAKAGVLNLTRSLAVEWAPEVRVNAVSPGPIGDTEGMKRLGEQTGLSKAVERAVPLGRMGTTKEIADACLFLCSDAATYITGACLVVDGGQDAVGPFGSAFQSMMG
jgi:NAD(P)-dependent dehydrogenase (short-subunit alcohol dehydrogenase family)